MSILRFRVTFEDYDDVHRDMDFEATHTFADLFNQLLSAVGFDNKHEGEFFLADHNWRIGKSIGRLSGSDNGKMQKVDLVDHIDDPHQKFLFYYEDETGWGFQIELIRVMSSGEYRAVYPKVSASFGTPPVQYKEELIIPVRENNEEETRGRKRKPKEEHDEDPLLAMLGSMKMDDDEMDDDDSRSAAAEDSEEADLADAELDESDLETDNEISKLAEEFSNTIETDDQDQSGDSDEYGDDEFGSDFDDDEYGNDGGGYGGGYGDDD
ncbi:MAG: hypothetical protein R2850_07885 [Bacteroidia bacterium]